MWVHQLLLPPSWPEFPLEKLWQLPQPLLVPSTEQGAHHSTAPSSMLLPIYLNWLFRPKEEKWGCPSHIHTVLYPSFHVAAIHGFAAPCLMAPFPLVDAQDRWFQYLYQSGYLSNWGPLGSLSLLKWGADIEYSVPGRYWQRVCMYHGWWNYHPPRHQISFPIFF